MGCRRMAGLGGGVSEDDRPKMGREEEYLLELEGNTRRHRLLGSFDQGLAMGVSFWGFCAMETVEEEVELVSGRWFWWLGEGNIAARRGERVGGVEGAAV